MAARTPTNLQAALEQVGIVPARWGAARRAPLTPAQSDLYEWLLRRFAAADAPTPAALLAWTAARDMDPHAALADLIGLDLAQGDAPATEVTVVYPFSRAPTPHRVWLESPAPVYAMCALDALGVSFLLARPVIIHSQDGLTGETIHLAVQADGRGRWEEAGVVLVGAAASRGPLACSCCPAIHFFTHATHAEEYVARQGVVHPTLLTFEEALVASRLLLGGVLRS